MSTQQSHAVDPVNQSSVPGSVQKNAPQGVENALPDSASSTELPPSPGPSSDIPLSVHNTDPTKDNEKRSHATGPSKVPQKVQELAPEGLERALPEKIHPTDKVSWVDLGLQWRLKGGRKKSIHEKCK